LRRQPGVRSARFNEAAGSILVEYDSAALTETTLLLGLPVSNATAPAVAGQTMPSSPAARAVARGWWAADSYLARVSDGRADLRTLVPAVLALLAAQQLLLQGELQAVPWHALLWYSYNLFFQFHLEMRQPPGLLKNG
jgi:hypothetical protein